MKYVSGRDIMLGRHPQLDVGTLQMRRHKRACRTRSDHHGFMPHMIVLHSLTASLRRAEPAHGNLVALALQGVGYRTPIERTDRKDGTFEVNRRALTFDV